MDTLEYCFEYSSNCTGQVLLAGNLARNASGDYYYNRSLFFLLLFSSLSSFSFIENLSSSSFPLHDTSSRGYPVPTLTVGGELDGLTRITRMMEGYYHQVLLAPSSSAAIQVSHFLTFSFLLHFDLQNSFFLFSFSFLLHNCQSCFIFFSLTLRTFPLSYLKVSRTCSLHLEIRLFSLKRKI